MSDDIRDALRILELPAEPPPGFADALFERLLDEATAPPPTEKRPFAPRRSLRDWWVVRQPRVRWVALTAVAVGIVLVATLMVSITRPQSAYAVVQSARAKFKSLPAFSAQTFSRVPGEMVGADSDRRDLPDLEVVRTVQYRDDQHWRTTVVSSTYDQPPAGFEAFDNGDRTGDYVVSDGTYVARYLASAHRIKVKGYSEETRQQLRAAATGNLDPGLYGFALPDNMIRQGCRVMADGDWLGRRAKRIECHLPGSNQVNAEMWIDKASGMVLRLFRPIDSDGRTYRQPYVFEVRSLTLPATFERATFDTSTPAGATAFWEGASTPPPPYLTKAAPGVDVVAVAKQTLDVAADDRGAWVIGRSTLAPDKKGASTLSYVDAATDKIAWSVATRDIGTVAVVGDVVLVGGYHDPAPNDRRGFAFVDRYDARSGRKLEPGLELPDAPSGQQVTLVGNGTFLWFTGGAGHPAQANGRPFTAPSLVRIDPSSGTVQQTVPLDVSSVANVSISQNRLWLAAFPLDASTNDPASPNVDLLGYDVATGRPTNNIRVHFLMNSFLERDGLIWAVAANVDEHLPSVIREIDPTTGAAAGAINVGYGAVDIVQAGSAVWITEQEDGTVASIDAASGRVTSRVASGDVPTHIAVGAKSLWVTSYRAGTVARVRL